MHNLGRLYILFFAFSSTPIVVRAQDVSATELAVDTPGVSIDVGAPLLFRPPVIYPKGATSVGTVAMELTLDRNGDVSETHRVSGPIDLRSAVLGRISDWHLRNDPPPPTMVRLAVTFSEDSRIARQASGPEIRTLIAVRFVGLPPDLEKEARETLNLKEASKVSIGQLRPAVAALNRKDPKLFARFGAGIAGDEAVWFAQVSLARPAADTPISRVRVGGNVQAKNLIQKVEPAYPAEARTAGIQGTVRFTAIIDYDGTIKSLVLVDGPGLVAAPSPLIKAAGDAVAQWRYRPTTLNGNPVEVITLIDVNFRLSQ